MTVYRLAAEPHLTLTGEGARMYPGRWNEKGTPCIYTSQSTASATLEVLVNTGDWQAFLFRNYKLIHIQVADRKIKIIKESELPENWNDLVVSNTTRVFGANLFRNNILAFAVPSVVVPLERNIILNPAHRDFKRSVSVRKITPFKFDRRLLKS